MYDRGIRYLARAFVDAQSVDTDPATVAGLIKKLRRRDLEVITALEQIGAVQSPRPFFRSKDESWQLAITSQSFDVSVLATKLNDGRLGKFDDFCIDSAKVLGNCVDFFERKAHRLAAVQEGFLPDMSDKQKNAIVRRLFKLPSAFEDQVPFEWDWRCASHIDRVFGKRREATNTIGILKRLSGTMQNVVVGDSPVQFDRIRLDIDINTLAQERATRFAQKEISAFFAAAPGWHDQLASQLLELIRWRARR